MVLLSKNIKSAISKSQLNPKYLDLELTETFEFELQSNLTILTKCNLSHKIF